jgi:hypothetical protein
MPDAVDIALKEFESVRAEIAAHQHTKAQYLTLAITATGAIGSFALGRNGNRDALLVLPLVLSGLTIIYLRHNVDIELLGQYVRRELWPYVARQAVNSGPASDEQDGSQAVPVAAASDIADVPSWDHWIQERRKALRRESAYGAMGILPPLLIFGAPSLGALVLSFARSWHHHLPLAIVWCLALIVITISLGLTLWSYTSSPGWKKDPFDMARVPTSQAASPTR